MRRKAADQRKRRSRRCSIAISAAGVTIKVSMVAKPSPNTMAVERLIHHCVAGAPTVISRDMNSMFMPNAIGSTPRIAVTAVSDSTLGRAADVVLAVPQAREACPHNLAPTTSTLMQAALGDALAIALLESRGFTAVDFGHFHPGGRLGAMLKFVRDIMHTGAEIPLATVGARMSEAIAEMTAKTFGCVGITDRRGHLVGIITDGDLRRHMSAKLLDLAVEEVMTPQPRTVRPDQLVSEALELEGYDVTQATNGMEALAMLASREPEVIILDLWMPVMDGWAFRRAQLASHPHIPVVVLSALWPILLNTTSAVRQIDPLLLDVARSFRLTALQRMRRIILPAIVPSLLLGIRVAIPLAIVVTLLVEMLTSLPGIGALMIRSQRNFQSSEVYALLVLVGLFGFVVNDLFAIIEGVIMRRWPPRS